MQSRMVAKLSVPVSEERDHIQGSPNAAVTLVEYGDFECPYCGAAHPIVKAIQKIAGTQLRFVFRHFPLTQMHPHAEHAAEAAESAGAQGKFWEMHDLLYENQQLLDDSNFMRFAGALGLDTAKFAHDLAGHAFHERISEDFLSGVRSGVNGTPTFFINDIRYDGSWEMAPLLSAIERAAAR